MKSILLHRCPGTGKEVFVLIDDARFYLQVNEALRLLREEVARRAKMPGYATEFASS